MAEDKRRGMIVLEFRMPDGEVLTEEARAVLIAGLERAFNFEIPGKTPELLSLFAQTWVGRSEEGDQAEAILMRGRMEYPVEVSNSARAAAVEKYFGGEMKEWRAVALSKWRHYKEMAEAYEIGKGHGNSSVALDVHAYGLAKMIPYLLGMPEEALQEFTQETRGKWGPHHHEERMPAYPSEGLDFTDEVRPPVPDAFEHGS
jgi:hypothetical protein